MGYAVGAAAPVVAAGQDATGQGGDGDDIGRRREPVRHPPWSVGRRRPDERAEARRQEDHIEHVAAPRHQPDERQRLGQRHDRQLAEATRQRIDPRQRQRPPPTPPRLTRRLVHPHGQQRGRVEERHGEPGRRQRPDEGDILDGVVGDRPETAGVEQRVAADSHALAVGQQPTDRPGAGRAGHGAAVDERRQQRRVQPSGQRGGALEAAGDGEHVEPVGDGPGDQGARQRRRRPGVGIEQHDPLPAGRLEPLLQRPRLADPSGGQRAPGQHGRTTTAGQRRRPVARLVVDDDHLGDARRPDDGRQQRADPRRLVPRRDDDADPRPDVARRPHRRAAAGGAGERAHRHHCGKRPCRGRGSHVATSSAAIIDATMRALIATSGSPPPGWLDPPTRYNPRTAPRLPGRTNAARRPFDDVP